MENTDIKLAYQYLNSLDVNKVALIPKEVWLYFEKKLDNQAINTIFETSKNSGNISKFINYIEQTYLYF